MKHTGETQGRLGDKAGSHRIIGAGVVVIGLAGLHLAGEAVSSGTKRVLRHQREFATSFVWDNLPRWEGGMLIGYTHNHSNSPILYTMDPDGRREEFVFAFPDACLMHVRDVAGSRNGDIAVIGSAYTSDDRSTTFLARISPDRKSQVITRLWPYCAMVVAFGADGTIWTVGHLKDEGNTAILSFTVLRRFDATGKMLGSTALRVKREQAQETSFLRSSLDRVGWFTRDNEYLEFSLDGREVGRYRGPEIATERDINGLAISDANNVVVGRFGHGYRDFATLNRLTGVWEQMPTLGSDAPRWAWVHGFDDGVLVTSNGNGSLHRYHLEAAQ